MSENGQQGAPCSINFRRMMPRESRSCYRKVLQKVLHMNDLQSNTWNTIETTPARRSVYHGWRVVAAAFLIAFFGWGIGFYGPGIYLVALQARNGWPTAMISSAVTIC